MRKERKTLKVSVLSQNNGQLPWLPKNPRQWTQTDIDRTANSINEDEDFLEDRPLLVVPDDKKYVVFAGNLRLTAAKKEGLTELPCVVYYPDTDEDHLTVKRRAMKDNGSFGSWDFDELANEWDDLPLTDWGIPAWDSSEDDQDADAAPAKEDNFDEEKEEIHVRCKPGDVWELGNHRLMCGDSVDLEQVIKLTGGGVIDMVFTDPPYGVSYVGTNNPNGKEWDMIENDDLRGDELYRFLAAAFSCIARTLKEDGAFYVWFASVNHIQFEKALNNAGLRVKQELIWDKGMVLGHSDYHWAYEPCLYGTHQDSNCKWYGDRKQKTFLALNRTKIRELKKEQMEDMLLNLHSGRTCWRIDRDNVMDYVHPTQKPVELAARAMRNSSSAGQSVLDLFGGSGTTLIAAEQMDRKCYMMELDPHYCDVIIARWEKFTGKTANKIS